VDAQKRQPDMPDRAEPGGGLRVVHIPVGAAGKRNCWPAYPRSVTLCRRAGAVSGLMSCTPSAGPAGSRPDGYPRSRHPGCAGIQLAWRRGAAEPRQRGPGHAAASQAPAGAGHGPARTVFAGAVTKTARLLASKGPQSTYVRNS
jgi:hypothetical protein